MTGLSVLLVGIGLGLRHATDADHVVVVSALIQREQGVWRAARVAALWGLGHTAAFLALGLLIVVAGLRVPDAFERGAELLVGTMLVALGFWHLWSGVERREQAPRPTLRGTSARPVVLGACHGLAGSAAIALLAVTTMESRLLASVYLGLVALGTVVGMVALTVVLSRPIAWAMRGTSGVRFGVTLFASVLSVSLGVMMTADVLFGEPAP